MQQGYTKCSHGPTEVLAHAQLSMEAGMQDLVASTSSVGKPAWILRVSQHCKDGRTVTMTDLPLL
jgi:hypothetical protein